MRDAARGLVLILAGLSTLALIDHWVSVTESRRGLESCRTSCQPRSVIRYESRWGGSVCVCDDQVDAIGFDRNQIFDRIEDVETDL
jgi:hypothetical protein